MAGSAPSTFSRTQIILHWTVVGLIAFQYLFSDGIEELWRSTQRGEVVEAGDAAFAYLHMFSGSLVLVLTIWRLVLRVTRGVPPPEESEPAVLRFLAKLVHGAIYLLIITLPVSGLVAWVFGVEGAAGAHVVMKTVLLPLIGLHVAGALVHHFIWKTDVLRRMLPAAH